MAKGTIEGYDGMSKKEKVRAIIDKHNLTTDISRNAAIGYMIIAAQSMGLDKETIRQLESNFKSIVDITPQEEGERVYNNFI